MKTRAFPMFVPLPKQVKSLGDTLSSVLRGPSGLFVGGSEFNSQANPTKTRALFQSQ